MDKKNFYAKIETIAERPAESVTGASKLDDIGWDSLSVVSFISFVDQEFHTTLSADSINSCETVDELADLLKGHVQN